MHTQPRSATPSSTSQRELHTEKLAAADTASPYACLYYAAAHARCCSYVCQSTTRQRSALVLHHCCRAALTRTSLASRRTKRPWHLLARKSTYPAAIVLSNSSTQLVTLQPSMNSRQHTAQGNSTHSRRPLSRCAARHTPLLCTQADCVQHTCTAETTPLCPPHSLPR